VRALKRSLRGILDGLQLPAAARRERQRDQRGLPDHDPGIDAVVDACMAWLVRAQEQSPTHDGGVARDFSLLRGWSSSYPETTGYIAPTFFEYAELRALPGVADRAFRMLDWLVSIQFPEGAFQGGRVDMHPKVPVTFNTGQILLGLAAGARRREQYVEPMRKAAAWLRDTQDVDGCWRRHPSPFAADGEKSYETHVAWGLFEAARILPDEGFAESAQRNIRWTIGRQSGNGWIADCCLNDAEAPLSHTLGYALRGLVEAFRFTRSEEFLRAARRTSDALVQVISPDGRLAGRLHEDWTAAVSWTCPTGSVQIAHSLLLLYSETGCRAYLDAGRALNAFVRRTVRTDGNVDTRGGVKGSFPIHGDYERYEYLSWAAKFCVDSNLAERALTTA
jgi:hypothetical protein